MPRSAGVDSTADASRKTGDPPWPPGEARCPSPRPGWQTYTAKETSAEGTECPLEGKTRYATSKDKHSPKPVHEAKLPLEVSAESYPSQLTAGEGAPSVPSSLSDMLARKEPVRPALRPGLEASGKGVAPVADVSDAACFQRNKSFGAQRC
mmetsp:Transcript_118283/g.346520  ORF Transcript_118283/g.346520 Transcript_118283/m.346520 type:complete len:151 (-) Transcript_118283:364-816(-)